MQIDLYTKAVLTIIAACLVALVAQNTSNTAHADDTKAARVSICDPDGGTCLKIVSDSKGAFGLPVVIRPHQ